MHRCTCRCFKARCTAIGWFLRVTGRHLKGYPAGNSQISHLFKRKIIFPATFKEKHVSSLEGKLVSWRCFHLFDDDQNFVLNTMSSHQTQKPSPTWLVKVSPSVWFAAGLAKLWVSKNFHLQRLWWKLMNLKFFANSSWFRKVTSSEESSPMGSET